MENKIKYEDIQKANEAIRTMTISRTDKKTGKEVSKEYAEVNQRIKAFRMVYPTGSITTDMINNENGICIFRAVVRDEIGNILATGTAYEKESSSFINQTSYIENCETSAIGRALGIAGFGIDTSVASAEEVQNAMANQDNDNEKLMLMVKLTKLVEQKGVDRTKLYGYYKVKDNADMTVEQLKEAIETVEKREDK